MKTDIVPVKTGFGLEYRYETLHWTGDKIIAQLEKYTGTINDGSGLALKSWAKEPLKLQQQKG